MRDHIDHGFRHAVGLLQYVRALARHDHQPVAVAYEFLHHMALRCIRLVQHGVKSGHHRHSHFLEQCEQMVSRRAAVDAELMLHAEHFRLVLVQLVRRSAVVLHILLLDFKTHLRRVIVAVCVVAHGDNDALRVRSLTGHRFTQVMGESCDATTAGHIVPEKGDPPGMGEEIHFG